MTIMNDDVFKIRQFSLKYSNTDLQVADILLTKLILISAHELHTHCLMSYTLIISAHEFGS